MLKNLKYIILACLIGILNINTVIAENIKLSDDNTVYFEDVVNTGKDNGYSKKYQIKKDDPHFGWKLGKFAISGFTSKTKDEKGNLILLKNSGDEITLYFNLNQNIKKLNGNKDLYITKDKDGYDNEFGLKASKTGGRGKLIIRKIDSTGNINEPKVYDDFLSGIEQGANTKIDIFEEGDYQVALDYEIKDDGFLFFNSYHNYRIRFDFSIRNGNTMIFPFDIKTKEELNNTSVTENGFYIDLANSKYLEVSIKREILNDGKDGLVEDIRYNKPAKSGDEFTEEGIYTITTKNSYTGETTIKKIYVGTDKILKAHVQTGRSIENIKLLLKEGAKIDENGNMTNIPKKYLEEYSTSDNNKNTNIIYILIFSISILLLIVVIYLMIKKKRNDSIDKKIGLDEEELVSDDEPNKKN